MIKITQLLYAACLMLVVSSISSGVRADPISMDVGVEIIAQSHMMWNGQPLPPYSQGQAEISILKYTIPPGAKLPDHIHDYAQCWVHTQWVSDRLRARWGYQNASCK